MSQIIMAIGDKPASEGLGDILSSALLIIGTLALIYGVLVLIDRYHKKHGSEDSWQSANIENNEPESFRHVLDDEIEKAKEKEKDGRV